MAGINIAFAADARAFLKGTGDIEESLDKVGDSLDDLARDAERQGRDIGDSLERAGEDGQDAAKALERTFRAAFDDVKRHARRATDDVADNTRRNMDDATDAVGEFKQEAKQNVSELASSFSGDFEDIGDAVQGTLGGLASSIPGPVGLISATLAGIGGALWASMNDNAAKSEQRVKDMYADMLESGLDFLSDQAVAEGIAKIFEESDDAAISLDRAREYADALGLSVTTVAAAFAGSGRAQAQVNAALTEARDRLSEMSRFTGPDTQGILGQSAEWGALAGVIRDVEGDLGRVNGELDNARERAREAREATEQWTGVLAEQSAERQRAAEEYSDILARYRELAESGNIAKTVSVDVDLDDAERTLRTWRPVVTATFRAGQAVI